MLDSLVVLWWLVLLREFPVVLRGVSLVSSAHPLPLGCCGPRSEHSQAGGGKACPTEMLRSEETAAWLAHSILWLALLEKMLGLKDGTDVVVDKALPPVGALG